MLPEITAEALQFLTRRDLDNAFAVSKWLDALIAQCCDAYPLRPVQRVALIPRFNDPTLIVLVEEDDDSELDHLFSSTDEAVHYTASIFRHSYVERLQLGAHTRNTELSPSRLSALTVAVRNGAVRHLDLIGVDLSAHDANAFHVAASVLPSGFVTDDRILAFLFPADAPPGRQSRSLTLPGTGISDMFLTKFFERLRMRSSVYSGRPTLHGVAAQRSLTAYARYLLANGTYRFPSTDDANVSYEVELYEHPSRMFVRFSLTEPLL